MDIPSSSRSSPAWLVGITLKECVVTDDDDDHTNTNDKDERIDE